MQKRRENECFCLQNNLKAVDRMRKNRSIDEGRKKHNEKLMRKTMRS